MFERVIYMYVGDNYKRKGRASKVPAELFCNNN